MERKPRNGEIVPRPTTRAQLLEQAETEFTRVFDAVEAVPASHREIPGACEAWSVKDLLAHLDAWHGMFLSWEEAGSSGAKPEMPAPGFSWSDTPALNARLQQQTADDGWDDVVARLQRSHEAALGVISSYGNDDLFTKRRYAWTGSTSVGSYAVSATSSHYAWASKLIRAWSKSIAS